MVHVIVDLLFLKGKSHQYSYEFFSPLSHCFTIFIILCCNIRMITISIFNIRLSSKENKYYSFAKKYLSYKVWYTWNNLASTDHLILYFMNYLTIQTSLWSKHQNWHIFNWYCFVSRIKNEKSLTTRKVCDIMFLCLKSNFLCLFWWALYGDTMPWTWSMFSNQYTAHLVN